MSTAHALARLRAANPAAAQPLDASGLFARIVAGPGDPRAARPAATRSRRRPLVLGAVALGLLGAGTAAGVLADDPLGIFRENPAWSDAAGQWHQDVLPGSVVLATSVDVPGAGRLEYWYGETRQGGWCAALRLPDGGWSGAPDKTGSRPPAAGDAGGSAPGCTPTREQINGTDPVYVITGFDYREGDLWTGEPWRSPFWRVYYGIVEGKGVPVRVIDTVSGTSAPVVRGRLFALAVPSDPNTNALHLVAYDASGRPAADDRVAGG